MFCGASRGYTLLECANRIRPSALHVTINSTNKFYARDAGKKGLEKGNDYDLLVSDFTQHRICTKVVRGGESLPLNCQ